MADNFELELPEELIQHIQSFLDAKDAVLASVLSKQWYNAWFNNPVLCLDQTCFDDFARRETKRYRLTNPVLCLDEKFFFSRGFYDFYDFARSTMNRYLISSRKICSLSLELYLHDRRTVDVDELILSALTLGVSDLHMKLLSVNLYRPNTYTLPDQVFSSIYLKKLRIDGNRNSIVVLPQSNGKSRVLWPRLVSLELSGVRVSDDPMRDILLGCPLMEDLRVTCCCLGKINLSAIRRNLRTFHVKGNIWMIRILFVEWQEVNTQHQFHSLISLKLNYVEVDDLFFKFFSHRFPCLERLELESCLGPVMSNIDITSNSLKYLSLICVNGVRFIKLQVPNIQNFTLAIDQQMRRIPSLSFITASAEWKSDLRFHHLDGNSNSNADVYFSMNWWLKIRDILTELSSSKISIAIFLPSDNHHIGSISAEIIRRNHISPFVENLKIEPSGRKFQFAWFLCCRPKYITWTWTDNLDKETSYDSVEFAYNELKKNDNKIVTNSLPCGQGLEEVDMEYYEETLRKWHHVPQEAKESVSQTGQLFRLRLKWN